MQNPRFFKRGFWAFGCQKGSMLAIPAVFAAIPHIFAAVFYIVCFSGGRFGEAKNRRQNSMFCNGQTRRLRAAHVGMLAPVSGLFTRI